jgi:DNA-binding MarR family transcriptional regulator
MTADISNLSVQQQRLLVRIWEKQTQQGGLLERGVALDFRNDFAARTASDQASTSRALRRLATRDLVVVARFPARRSRRWTTFARLTAEGARLVAAWEAHRAAIPLNRVVQDGGGE